MKMLMSLLLCVSMSLGAVDSTIALKKTKTEMKAWQVSALMFFGLFAVVTAGTTYQAHKVRNDPHP